MQGNRYGLLFVFMLPLLPGCSTPYSCKLSEGFKCKSLAEAYALDEAGGGLTDKGSIDRELPAALAAREPVKATEGTPIFQPPRRLRIWLADWRHRTIYVPNHYLYLRVDAGQWRLPPAKNATGEDTDVQ